MVEIHHVDCVWPNRRDVGFIQVFEQSGFTWLTVLATMDESSVSYGDNVGATWMNTTMNNDDYDGERRGRLR